jgi:hypothetical protein
LVISVVAESHVTGEESDETLYKMRCKAFVLEKAEKGPAAWHERGTGTLKLNRLPSGRVRVVMRVEGVHRLVLNSLLFPEMAVRRMNERGVSVACFTDDPKPVAATYLLRVARREDADELVAALEKHKNDAQAVAAAAAASPAKPAAETAPPAETAPAAAAEPTAPPAAKTESAE